MRVLALGLIACQPALDPQLVAELAELAELGSGAPAWLSARVRPECRRVAGVWICFPAGHVCRDSHGIGDGNPLKADCWRGPSEVCNRDSTIDGQAPWPECAGGWAVGWSPQARTQSLAIPGDQHLILEVRGFQAAAGVGGAFDVRLGPGPDGWQCWLDAPRDGSDVVSLHCSDRDESTVSVALGSRGELGRVVVRIEEVGLEVSSGLGPPLNVPLGSAGTRGVEMMVRVRERGSMAGDFSSRGRGFQIRGAIRERAASATTGAAFTDLETLERALQGGAP